MLKDKHENNFMNRIDQEFTRVKTTLDYTVTCLQVGLNGRHVDATAVWDLST